ncbi:MAG: hypothetical protein AB7O45_00540 [Alphaproteobacteria bacterium]
MGTGPIPWTAIDRYAERNGITDPDDLEEFVELVTAMDHAYLEHAAKDAEQKAKAAKAKAPRGRR